MTSARERLIRLLEASAGKEPQTPAEELRTLLTELEIRVANMDETGEEVLVIPRLLDRATALLADLQAAGVDVKPEETRLLTVQGLLRSKAAVFVREANKGQGLKAARAPLSPPREHWWWYLDDYIAHQRRQRITRAGLAVLAGVVVIALLFWFIQSRLPSDPRLRRIIDVEQALDTHLSDGDLAAAIADLEELRRLDPTNPSYAVLLGALYEAKGQMEQADEQYRSAQVLVDPAEFHTLRARAYLQIGRPDKARDEAEAAVSLRPDDPESYFYLGNAYEALGDIPSALQAYETASKKAEEQNNAELLAIIRVRMAFLLQRIPAPTPTADQ